MINFSTILEKIKKCKKNKMLSEARIILGHNPIQLDTRDKLLRALAQWNRHITIENHDNHSKIRSTRTGNVIHKLTNSSKIGPKTSIDILSAVRDELVSAGVEKFGKKNKKESRGLSVKKQNQTVEEKPQSAIPLRSPEYQKERLAKLKSIAMERLGQKRAGRIKRAIQRSEMRVQS